MLYIQKTSEPEWLKEFKRKNPRSDYQSGEFDKYRYILRETLLKEQKYLCAYCCGRIDDENSHNEHIEPQNPGSYASRKSLDYHNIVASCNGFKGDDTCGIHKRNEYDETKFISPLDSECENRFTYYPDGTIEGDKYTIDLLNLNFYGLKSARKAVYSILQTMDKATIQKIYLNEEEEKKEPFTNVIKWYVQNHS